MTSPDNPSSPQPSYSDRVYRSGAALAGGVLLLALAAWLGIDAMIRGTGRAPWYALAGLLFAVPVIVAFTLRPAVFAGEDRLRVRNPFRTITLPWARIEAVRSGYSSEVFADDGRKFQLWAIPVSLRARKRVARQSARAMAEGAAAPEAAGRAPSDQAIDEIQELAERHAARETAQGGTEARWAYEIIAPAAAGAVLLIVLALLG